MDPLVSLDGTEALPAPEETTAGRIVAAGGSARAASTSVTDGDGVRALFEELGRVDGVVNVAGISRPTSFARGEEGDWRDVLTVHLGGYLAVLSAALPMMAAAGRGRILGVTSGSGWRPADAGAYSCAKRAVASLTWQLGRAAPPGVVVNAISPIAVTRMVTAALGRGASRPAGSSRTGGLSLSAMPSPEELGPLGAHLVSEGFASCQGRVLFAGGSEVAVIDEPRLIEVVRTGDLAALPVVLETVASRALAPAEVQQVSTGGSNPRFAQLFDGSLTGDLPAPAVRSCALVADDRALAAAITSALEARGVTCTRIESPGTATGFAGAAGALAAAAASGGPLDALVVALAGGSAAPATASGWERVLDEHDGLVAQIQADAGWARAVAEHAMAADRPVRLVTLTDATTAGGRSRAQAAAQLARAGRGATGDRVAAFAIAVESHQADDQRASGELVAHLVGSPEGPALAGAELAVGPGWLGVRSHPRPMGSLTYGGPQLPEWFDCTLRSVVA
jgi:hypothetical protein